MLTSKATQVHAQCAICNLWFAIVSEVKSGADSKPDTHEVEQICPECAGEGRITVADNGAALRQLMKPHYAIKEGVRYGDRSVGVAKCRKCVLGEAVYHRESLRTYL